MQESRLAGSMSGILGLTILALASAPATAAPGYTYELIYLDQDLPGQSFDVRHAAINNAGQVVFMTQGGPGVLTYRVYIASAMSPMALVLQSTHNDNVQSGPFIEPSWAMGLNDDGVIGIPQSWNNFDAEMNLVSQDYGYGLYEPGVGLVTEIRDLRYSSGRPNASLQMGGISYPPVRAVVTDGVTTSSVDVPLAYALRGVQINDAGTVASASYTPSTQNTVVFTAIPPAAPELFVIGPYYGLGYTSTLTPSPGLNQSGWTSFFTEVDNTNVNPNPRVLLISPAGEQSVIAEAQGTNFVNFRQPRSPIVRGVALNNFNEVAFNAELLDSSEAIWVGDASGDNPHIAIDEMVTFADGSYYQILGIGNDVTNFGTNSMNDAGEIAMIAFGAYYSPQGVQVRSSTYALVLARPIAGMVPGNPIYHEPGDVLPGTYGGWRFRGRCPRSTVVDIPGSCDQFGGTMQSTPRLWINPPISVGYDYTIDESSAGAFKSVLVPVALPGGDTEFAVEVNGAPATLVAGTVLDFSAVSPDPVRTFRITGIDPANSSGFITGLTFSTNTDEDVSFTTLRVVLDPSDSDSDGVPDKYDDFPLDPKVSGDTDGDGVDDNADMDDDGDGLADIDDDYPWGRFDDAAPGYWSFPFVERLARTGITAGCGGDNFCPESPVTRAQMAVFLERGINGSTFVPPAPSGTVFLDVGAGAFAAAFIEQLYLDGITAGCGGGNFCPNDTVTRAQMAVFLLRAMHGTGYSPPAPSGVRFADVGATYWAAAWIEQLASEGITSGCGGSNYCPEAAVTRAQMAVFLVRAFGL